MSAETKKKIAFHLFFIILIAIPVAFLFYAWGANNYKYSPDYKYTEVTRKEPCVYVTSTGGSYHSSSCGALHSSKIAKGRAQASEEGYLPCQRCNGTPSGTITVTYTIKEKMPMGGKHVVLSVLLSILTTPFVYMFVYVSVTSWKEDAWIRESLKKSKTTKCVSAPKNIFNKPTPPRSNFSQTTTPPPKPITERERLRKFYLDLTDYQVELLVGKAVMHKIYGAGRITKIINRQYIEVLFDDTHNLKKFIYPDGLVDKHLEIQ